MAYVEIFDYLKQLVERYKEDLFFIVSPKGHSSIYNQFMMHDENTFYWEVVSNDFLPEDLQLSQQKVNKLERMGFTQDELEPNFSKIVKIENEFTIEEMSKEILRIFVEIFDVIVTELVFELDLM